MTFSLAGFDPKEVLGTLADILDRLEKLESVVSELLPKIAPEINMGISLADTIVHDVLPDQSQAQTPLKGDIK